MSRPLRILHISTVSTWGLGEAYVLRMAGALRDRGMEVHVACRAGSVLAQELAGHPVLPVGRELLREFGVPDDSPVVGCVGRLSNEKGQADLIDGVPALLKQCPDAHVVLVGGDDSPGKPVLSALKKQSKTLGIEGRVIFAGFTSEVSRFFSEVDVAVRPSREDALLRTILEAMSPQAPLVATRAVSVVGREVPTEFVCAVGPRDPSALANALAWLLGDREAARELGLWGRALVEESFDQPMLFDRLIALHREAQGHEAAGPEIAGGSR